VLRQALSKRMTDRYPSIREFSRALQEAAFGSRADITPAPEPLPIGPIVGGRTTDGTPSPERLGASGEKLVPLEVDETEPDAKRATTFSQTASELTERPSARRFRPVYAIVAALGLVLALGAWFWFGSSGSDRRLRTGRAPAAAMAPAVTPAPAPAPVVVPRPAAPAPDRTVKTTSGTATEKVLPAEPVIKRKVPRARPKRRIFEDL
jgi:hypothetical protein